MLWGLFSSHWHGERNRSPCQCEEKKASEHLSLLQKKCVFLIFSVCLTQIQWGRFFRNLQKKWNSFTNDQSILRENSEISEVQNHTNANRISLVKILLLFGHILKFYYFLSRFCLKNDHFSEKPLKWSKMAPKKSKKIKNIKNPKKAFY